MAVMVRCETKTSIFREPLDRCTTEEIYAYYRRRKGVRYFAVVDEHEAAPQKIEAILENRFEFNHETYELPPGFDWTRNPSSDVEWLILLHKFYYAVGLGRAYRQSGDRRYLDKWVELTSSWMETVPVDFLPSDVTGRRLQNWIFAHYYFVTENARPSVPADFYVRFLESIQQQTRYLCRNLTPARNHRTLELCAIFFAAVVFPEMRGADAWLDFARREIYDNMRQDLLPDGVHCELSTDYHHIVLRNYLAMRRLAQLNDVPMPDGADALLRKALSFSVYVHKPDGQIPSLSDGDTASFLPLLRQGFELYGDPHMLYVATQGREGTPPSARSTTFRHGGYTILRSGWGDRGAAYEDEKYLIFDCGPLGRGNHGHFDLLSFEMAAFGQSLIVDPGRYTYDESGAVNWRVVFRSTWYHNTVVVDGHNQVRYVFDEARKKYKVQGPEPEYELKAFVSRSDFDFVHGVARSHEYDAVHERKIFFLCPEYWLITDLLRAPRTHDYELLFHLSAAAYGKTSIHTDEAAVLVHAPHLLLAQSFQPDLEVTLETGYVSPSYGRKIPAPVLRFGRRAANTTFCTVLYPFQSEEPQIAVERLPVWRRGRICPDSEAMAIRVTLKRCGQTFVDTFFIVHGEPAAEYRFGDFRFRGRLFFVRTDDRGAVVRRHTVERFDVEGGGNTR